MKLLHFLALAGFLMALETAIPSWRNKAPVATPPMADKAIDTPAAVSSAPSTSPMPPAKENPDSPAGH